jgi:predicted RNase H-like nuclease (RuvC/YqgF family)
MAPYGVTMAPTPLVPAPEHRRLKKKEQNKTAALRYRVKKREEKGVKLSEVETLEERNDELRARADDLQREIEYLRALLAEIRQP